MTGPHPVNMAALVGIGAPMAAGVAYVAYRTRDLAHSTAGGWATAGELRNLTVRSARPGRVTLGKVGRRLVAAEERASLLVLGPAGSGKTLSLAVPTLREWQGPVVATSVKNDLVDLTAEDRPDPVWIFDPTSRHTASWSPVDGCGSWRRAVQMASWIIAAAKAPGTERDAFWYANAGKLLAPILHAAALEGWPMSDVVDVVDRQRWRPVFGALDPDHGAPGDTRAAAAFGSILAIEDRQRSSVISSLGSNLLAFADPLVAAATARSDFSADQLLDENGTLYVCGPLHEQRRIQPLYSALVGSIVAEAYERPHPTTTGRAEPSRPSLLLLLDEVCNVAPIEDLDGILSTGRAIGVQTVAIAQDLAQLENRYGDGPRPSCRMHGPASPCRASPTSDPSRSCRASPARRSFPGCPGPGLGRPELDGDATGAVTPAGGGRDPPASQGRGAAPLRESSTCPAQTAKGGAQQARHDHDASDVTDGVGRGSGPGPATHPSERDSEGAGMSNLNEILPHLSDALDTAYSRFVMAAEPAEVEAVLERIEEHVARWRSWSTPDRGPCRDADMLGRYSADELQHMAAAKREMERTEAEQRVAHLAELYERPALGAYRRLRPVEALDRGTMEVER